MIKTAQGALLRVLETGTFARGGSVKELRVDVRVIAATHRDLDVMAREGRFREDLWYRLNAVTLEVPPLRERVEDIAPLARFFLELANEANDRNIRGITPEALRALDAYVWPGNVRELRNAIDRALVMTRSSMIELGDLPEKVRGAVRASTASPATAAKAAANAEETKAGATAVKTAKAGEGDAEERGDGTLRASIRAYEARMITLALRNAGGRRKIAARKLGMPLRSLAHKIKALGVEVAEDDDDDDASPGATK